MRQTPGWTDFVEILNGTYCTAKWNFWIVLGWRQRFRRYPCMEPKVLLEGWQSTTAVQSAFSTKLLPTYSFTCLGVCISMQVCTRAYECVCMPWCLCQGQRKISGVRSCLFFFFFEAGVCQAIWATRILLFPSLTLQQEHWDYKCALLYLASCWFGEYDHKSLCSRGEHFTSRTISAVL